MTFNQYSPVGAGHFVASAEGAGREAAT